MGQNKQIHLMGLIAVTLVAVTVIVGCATKTNPPTPNCDQATVGSCTTASDAKIVGCVEPTGATPTAGKVKATGGCWKNGAGPQPGTCTAIGTHVVYVKNGVTGGDGTSFAKAFSTVQQAVDEVKAKRPATSTDLYVIAIAQGTYLAKNTVDSGAGYYAGVDSKGQANLHIWGGFTGDKECKENHSDDAKLTVIDTEAEHENRVLQLVYDKAGDGKNVTVEGLTLTGAGNGGAMRAGGAIRAQFVDLKLVNLRFVKNVNDEFGAAVALFASNTVIQNCVFVNNEAAQGGAIFTNNIKQDAPGAQAMDMTVSISNCIFGNKDDLAAGANKATGTDGEGKGGAIWNRRVTAASAAGKSLTVTITDSSFFGNEAGGDGGAIFNDGTLALKGTTLFQGNKVAAGRAGSAIANRKLAPKAIYTAEDTVKFGENFVGTTAQTGAACVDGP